MQIEIIETLDGLDGLKQDWDELYAKAQPGVFMHHSWVYNNYRLLGSGDILLLAVYADARKLIGVFPFAIRPMQIRWFRYRALVHGGSEVTDYSQFLVDPQANNRLMIKRIIEKLDEIQPDRWDIICMENMSDGIDNSKLFVSMARRHFYAGSVAREITPIINFDHEYAEAKKVSNIKRRFRKIANDCSIEHLASDEITPEHMMRFSELHQRSFPDAGFDREAPQRFYRALIDDPDFSGHVQLSTIHHRDELIAAHFGFQDWHCFYYYVPTYNEAYSTNGPGQYLLWKLIDRARDAGKAEFDLLRGCEDYKFNWTNKINNNYTLFGVPVSAGRGRRLLVNLWLLTRSLPYFSPTCLPRQ